MITDEVDGSMINSEYSESFHTPNYEDKVELERMFDFLAKNVKSNKHGLAVIYYRFFQGLTLKETGEKIGVCGDRVRAIEFKALRMMRHPASRSMWWRIWHTLPKNQIGNLRFD